MTCKTRTKIKTKTVMAVVSVEFRLTGHVKS